MIDAILWVLQTPHPLFIVIAFACLTWVIQRSGNPLAARAAGSCLSEPRLLGRNHRQPDARSFVLRGVHGSRRADRHLLRRTGPARIKL